MNLKHLNANNIQQINENINDDDMYSSIYHYLEATQLSPSIEKRIESLSNDQFDRLCKFPALVKEAEDTYKFATDTGVSISLSEQNIITALESIEGK